MMKTLPWMICGLMLSLPAAAQDKAQGKPSKPEKAPAAQQEKAGKAGAKDATASAVLRNAEGKQVGEAKLTQAEKGVVVRLKITGLPEGSHAFHIHETGKCEAPFTSAGGHYNPKKKAHGIRHPKGMHAGDFPNLEIPKDGNLEVELFTDAVTLKKGATSVFDADGSAFIIHAGADDYHSQPAGAAGDRIACGVIEK